jgi:hypothetical protein
MGFQISIKVKNWLLIMVLVGVLMGAWSVYSDHAKYRIAETIYDAIEDGDAARAMEATHALRWVDRRMYDAYFADISIMASIKVRGEIRAKMLDDARQRMKGAKFDQWPSQSKYDVDIQIAALNAMLGQHSAAIQYAQKSCNEIASFPKDLTRCLHKALYEALSDLNYGNRRQYALRLYEVTKAIQASTNVDRRVSKLNESIALLYFDPSQARQLRDELVKEGMFDEAAQVVYCTNFKDMLKAKEDADFCQAIWDKHWPKLQIDPLLSPPDTAKP